MKTDSSLVLVVDDNEANRDVLSRRLKRQGITAITAENGRAALEMVRGHRFDLILLDVMMPEMNGYQVLETLKADPLHQHIPVIMISAVDDIDSVVRCIELGAEDYLFKPFNPVLLRARVGASLEKKRLRDQERAYVKAVKQELELGRRTQADFFPHSLPDIPGWCIATAFNPAREVAGDFYDVFRLPDNRIGLVIADVCDKGVRAALFMVLVRSLIRAFAEQTSTTPVDALHSVVLTNNYITSHHHNNRSHLHMFATLFFGVLNPENGRLTYINGGHEAPVVVGPSGMRQLLEPTGPAVGFMPGSQYHQEQIYLEPGEFLLAYTDGVTEARAPGGDLFTEHRLFRLLDQPVSSAEVMLQRVQQAVSEHIEAQMPHDDITLLAVQRLAE
ncbi:MAG: SpoIIE family protein phosphatase [Chloroflexaceae bacterium]|nr:SpoIIE family protein phosphatase [Chloroflexaceae bacterium]NJO06436.1 SpoIIE family protein phosphatase [Chloroflexaceae bacterium]